ncbi:putative quinol monooxygenase [Spirosoma endbachense]|uniref:Antibiotic biosynthesis monooxygenase n=1 Tax=Spirosoma endbachense TaxID=2666025 RepID=A0A6P1VVU4_9BACT|nr:putative quinol monooxygenase [Spirosoma endbachense]QHV96488.1 antibiotic biosynthesis monooxygenase [Spirosoma endbachense]
MSSNAITTFAKWQVKEGKLETVLALLANLSPQSREENGNLFYNVYQSTTDPNVIVLLEGYTNEVALAEHRNSPYFQKIVIQEIVPLLENREVILTTELKLKDI